MGINTLNTLNTLKGIKGIKGINTLKSIKGIKSINTHRAEKTKGYKLWAVQWNVCDIAEKREESDRRSRYVFGENNQAHYKELRQIRQ